ncbi:MULTISPECIES: RICIN domain-containing protein [unclassified Bacillus (in: firmicutes)]|uniref:RICIN domain-containing protein n=1 Tax=unclassified Bacillus (in: firmicutes) TaxID=185979 RepID=UPI0008E58379|nr:MULTISPECIES: RICIN domain-containing protein [unclassified Bacillus (in: firmicutes)]SFI06140.1 Ricin-type beta-trefoil lectin domain-like [Bacillus sp. 71mf]SFS79020.1 Ricin-type beta-trefoil lectin domain-like [Bacillus sp. 103mf]
MNVKRKRHILTILSLAFSLGVTIFPTNSAYANEVEDDRILDIYGDPIRTNKDYILVHKELEPDQAIGVPLNQREAAVGAHKHGITFDTSNGSYYPATSHNDSYYGGQKHYDTKGNVYYGTPINFEAPRGERGDGYLRNDTQVSVSMKIGDNSRWGGAPKYNLVNHRFGPYFIQDKSQEKIYTVLKENSKELNLVADRVTQYRDKFGRPTNSYNAHTSYISTRVLRSYYTGRERAWVQHEGRESAGLEVVPIQNSWDPESVNGTYHLIAGVNGTSVVDMSTSTRRSGDPNIPLNNVHLHDKHDGGNQKWIFEYDQIIGAYQIKSATNPNLVLAWNDSNNSNNVFATQNEQKLEHYWIPEDAGSGYVYLKNFKNQNKVLDVQGRGTSNGTNIIVHDNNNGWNQSFKLEKLD